MQVRFFGIIGFVLIALSCASQASAECGVVKSIATDVKRRQCWPEPFATPDRAATRAPFATMVSNGWRRQNMLGDIYFAPNSSELTDAGRMKVRWILVNAPKQHRLVYVHAADTDEITKARIATVVQLANQISPNDVPPVLPTTIADDGWPAAEVGAIGRKYMESIPKPRLAPSTGSSSGGGGSSGGSGMSTSL